MGIVNIEERTENLVEVDAALEYLNHEGTTVMTAIDETKLVRKIDWMIVPLMWACYMLQYLDKTLSPFPSISNVPFLYVMTCYCH